jgi:hypothetical protein
MANLLAGKKEGFVIALRSIYGNKLPIRTLMMHVRCLLREIAKDPPARNVNREWIGWIRDHWGKAKGLPRSFATTSFQTEKHES